MEENLFSIEDLQAISIEAQNPIYSIPNLFHFGEEKLSIIGVSQSTGLIMANGNEWTGYKHIIERHSLTSRKPYWTEPNKIDNPTKFSLTLPPVQYLDVASLIFKPQNKTLSGNKNPEIFDVYIGSCNDKSGQKIQYKLVVYKNFKVIHTLFVNDNQKPFNKKKILNLRQGWSDFTYNLLTGIQQFEFQYFDANNIALFKVIVRIFEFQRLEKWYVQVNLKDGTPFLSTLIKQETITTILPPQFRISHIDFGEITWVEKIIKKIIDNKFSF